MREGLGIHPFFIDFSLLIETGLLGPVVKNDDICTERVRNLVYTCHEIFYSFTRDHLIFKKPYGTSIVNA